MKTCKKCTGMRTNALVVKPCKQCGVKTVFYQGGLNYCDTCTAGVRCADCGKLI